MSVHRWTRKPTVIGGRTEPDDWTVYRDDIGLGRVLRSPLMSGVPEFTWASWTDPPQLGYADSLAEALEACRADIADKPVPDHIRRRAEQ